MTLLFSFKTDFNERPENLTLVLEQPRIYEIKVNGKPAEYQDTGWWIDTSFKKLDISGYVNIKGDNTVN